MHRLGGSVISEANPMVTSSAAKEESLSDMLKVVSKYANIIVMRHFNDVDAREAAPYSESPIINGGWGHWNIPPRHCWIFTRCGVRTGESRAQSLCCQPRPSRGAAPVTRWRRA